MSELTRPPCHPAILLKVAITFFVTIPEIKVAQMALRPLYIDKLKWTKYFLKDQIYTVESLYSEVAIKENGEDVSIK